MIDFSKAKVLDRQWCNYFRRRIDDLENANLQQVAVERRRLMAVRLLVTPAEHRADDYKKLHDEVSKFFDYYFPWVEGAVNKEKESKNRDLRDLWVREFGDPNDPEVQARIDATVKALSIN